MDNVLYFMRTQDSNLSAQVRRLLAYALRAQKLQENHKIVKNKHGKPYFEGCDAIQFSLSHTRGAVICALSEQSVGVDIEHPREIRDAFAARFYTSKEVQWASGEQRRLLEIWTRKEAALKCSGNGLNCRLDALETQGREDIVTQHIEEFTISFCGSPPSFRLYQVSPDDIRNHL